MILLERGKHGAQILFRLGGGDAAQHVVGAHFHDRRVGMIGQRPVQPRQPVRAGVAGDAGIDDFGVDPLRL